MNAFTTEIAPFAEYPGAWFIWALNMSAVIFVVCAGAYAALRKKVRYWLPLVIAFVLSYGWRWMISMPLPQIVKSETVVDADGRMIPMISHSASIDLIAWGAAAAIMLSSLKKRPIQPPQSNAGSRPSSADSSASETPSSLGPRG